MTTSGEAKTGAPGGGLEFVRSIDSLDDELRQELLAGPLGQPVTKLEFIKALTLILEAQSSSALALTAAIKRDSREAEIHAKNATENLTALAGQVVGMLGGDLEGFKAMAWERDDG